jgi:two-component system, OmpR family, response regulator MprA
MAHLLVVDNDPAISAVLKEGLELDPTYRVTSASSGSEALQVVARDRPDAAIIDVLMPEMSGIDLAEHVLGTGVPVLLISGNFETTAELERIGCHVLLKPFGITQLLAEAKILLATAADQQAKLVAQLRRLKENIAELAATTEFVTDSVLASQRARDDRNRS